MKIFLTTSPPSDSWVAEGLSKEVFNLVLKSVLDTTVLLDDENLSSTIRELHLRYPQLLNVVVERIKQIPRVKHIRRSDVDCVLASPDNITTISSSPRYMESLGRHTSIGALGESRNDFYERLFGHLLRNANKFVIYDPYALQNLGKHYTGISWLINERLSSLPIEVEIHSVLFSDNEYETNELALSRSVNAAKETLSKAKNIHNEFKVFLNTYQKSKTGKHDRFARIRFDFDSVSFELSKGAEIFRDSSLSEAFKPHALSLNEFEAKRATWPLGSMFSKIQLA